MRFEDSSTRHAVDDRVIGDTFGCGLTVADLSGRLDVSREVAERLCDVIDELDLAVITLRDAAYAALIAGHKPAGEIAARDVAVVASTGANISDSGASAVCSRRRLSRFGEGMFAYALYGHDFYRASDDELWAHERDGLLLSARSGAPLARRAGRVFYDFETNVPLYYEDDHTEPHATRRAELLHGPDCFASESTSWSKTIAR